MRQYLHLSLILRRKISRLIIDLYRKINCNKGAFVGFSKTGTTSLFSTITTPANSRGTSPNADVDIATTDIAPPALSTPPVPSAPPSSPVATNIAPLQPPPFPSDIDNDHQFLDSDIDDELFNSASNSPKYMGMDEFGSVVLFNESSEFNVSNINEVIDNNII